MKKTNKKGRGPQKEVQAFLSDITLLSSIPINKKFSKQAVPEYPFDEQLLSLSSIYRTSRKLFLKQGGSFVPRVCSTMRSLSSPDLFQSELQFSPLASEMTWFKDHWQEVYDPEVLVSAMTAFNQISLYHEQNHRILWNLLPRAPEEQRDFCRYLNFAESLVITLDLILGDQIGKKYSDIFERLKSIYRPAGADAWSLKSSEQYRQYLLAVMYVSYLALELVHHEDIPKALDYVLPGQKKINKDAVERGLELSELFTLNTNLQWQKRYWKQAQEQLFLYHKNSKEDVHYLPEDPLDFEEEFVIAQRVLNYFLDEKS
ncbi:hypothetical protein AZI85_09220 [Bdellovibrio bacteriovorus]|uniref:Uncharacterized protein n=1 Tax=Bdellovibrio bacteriovorus TaxID=959 RepID=A0A150WDH7_BDEBC|nr:hypothetical protein [Bdellovibrio bacteriovorus]KYG61125.1 hypothetical protein AZI85_09220 [Bdellovibrio bacteriovorus]